MMPQMEQNNYKRIYHKEIKGAFSIAYKETPGTLNPTYHVHDQYELLLCLSDHMFCDVGAKKLRISADTLLMFSSTDLHLFGTEKKGGPNRRYVLYFDPSYLSYLSVGGVNLLDCFLFRPFEDAYCLKLSPEQSETLQKMMRKILEINEASEEENYGKELRIQLALAELLLEINVYYRQNHSIKGVQNGANPQLIYDIIEFINTNYADEIPLDFLAQKFYINKYSLCQNFKRVTGISPNQYIINYRIERAKEMLIRGDNVEKVCMQAGFNNLSHFSRTFKNKVGMSPKKFQVAYR